MSTSSTGGTKSYFVQLSASPVYFDPVASNVNVFFDDANQHVFVVRSNGAGGIIMFDGNAPGRSSTFRVEDRGDITAVRFSPNLQILAVQRAPNALDFLNFPRDVKKESTPYCQTCKGKTSRITDFFWASNTEIIFVTDSGLEFYEVDPEKKSVKCTKTQSIGLVNWSLWHKESKHLVISSGVYGNILYSFHYDNGTLSKYSKLEVELVFYPVEPKLTLLRRDVILAMIYKQIYILALKQDSRTTQPVEVVLYKLAKEKVVSKTNVLKFNASGQFQVNIVDSLILVHHLQSKTTFLYDLKFASINDQQVAIHQQPLLAPLSMRQVTEKSPFVPNFLDQSSNTYEMYSGNWIVFQPDIIIDAVQGCMWKTEIYLPAFANMIADRCLLIEVLLHRAGAKQLILEMVREMIRPSTTSTLTIIGEVFGRLNQVYAYNEDKKTDFEILSLTNTWLAVDAVNVIQQEDIYTHVFCPVFNDDAHVYTNKSFPVAVMIEYITSLQTYDLPIYFYLYELLVNTLVKCGDMFRLHQFLQYHVMTDSKHLACLLLSIQNVYPAAYQIAVDMLKRLDTAHDQIVEVFLSKHQVLTAIRYLRSVGKADSIQPHKFLSVAKDSGDPDLFYITYKFFEEINIKQRKIPGFAPSDHCAEFERHFTVLFEQ